MSPHNLDFDIVPHANMEGYNAHHLLLNDKSRRTESLLLAAVNTRSTNKFIRTLSYVLNSQHEEGSWGSQDYAILKPLFTVQQIDTLLRVGIGVDAEWEVKTRDKQEGGIASIRKALEWVITTQRQDGSWGEDFWDSCQVIKVLLKAGYSAEMPIISKGIRYLHRIIDSEWKLESQRLWYGPGFYAAAIEVFFLLRDDSIVENLLHQVWASQDPDDGKFSGPKLPDGGYRSGCEWHTANVLTALHSIGISTSKQEMTKGIKWLRASQSKDGSWGAGLDLVTHFYTSMSIITFIGIEGPQSAPVQKGIQWFLDKQDSDGFMGDLSTTCMGAMAFSWVYKDALSTNLPFKLVIDTIELIAKYRVLIDQMDKQHRNVVKSHNEITAHQVNLENTILALQSENQRLVEQELILAERVQGQQSKVQFLEQEMASYWVRLTDKQIGIIGFLVGLLGLVLGILPLFL